MRFVDGNKLGQGIGVELQCPVKRLAGNPLGHQPRQHQTDWPQQQQRRKHPVQDLPEQAALLVLENFHPGIFSRQ